MTKGRMYPKTLKSYITNPRICTTALGSSRDEKLLMSQRTLEQYSPTPFGKRKQIFKNSFDEKDARPSEMESSTKMPADTTFSQTPFDGSQLHTQGSQGPQPTQGIAKLLNMDPAVNEIEEEQSSKEADAVPMNEMLTPRNLKTANLQLRLGKKNGDSRRGNRGK